MNNANEPGQPPTTELAPADWSKDLLVPSTALAIGAHPDDIEFGAGGTLAKWAAAGCEIHHLVLTDGSKGTWDADADTSALVARRKNEQMLAHRLLGGHGSLTMLGAVDGELIADLSMRSAVARIIREVRPEVVLAHDPWKRYRLHPDHREAGRIACDAIVAARDPHFHREHRLDPHRPQHLLLWEADVPDHVEDISATIASKLNALHAHESQFESTMKAVDPEGLRVFDDRITTRARELGSPHGLGAAELFHRMSDL